MAENRSVDAPLLPPPPVDLDALRAWRLGRLVEQMERHDVARAVLTDEYPRIVYPPDWASDGYDGELVAGNVLTVESFVGSDQGGPGVKLEDMYLVTDVGPERLSTYSFEEGLLS